MKILVTGSSGHLGNEIAKALRGEHDVIGIDRVEGPHTTHIADLNETESLPDVDIVFHTAALHAPHVGKHSDSDFINTNIQGTLNLLEYALSSKAKRFILTSSTSTFGNSLVSEGVTWVDETLTPQPRDIYDITKMAAEELCYDFYRRYQLPITCIRVGRFWNEPMPDQYFYRMYRGLDVRDAVAAHLLCLKPEIPEKGTYVIAAQSPFNKDDLPELARDPWGIIEMKVPGLKQKFEKEGWPLPERIDRIYDISKAKKELGYQPQYNIHEMLKSD